MKSAQVARTPFFGKYILETMGKKVKRETAEERRRKENKLKEIFETIDDYVEQA